MVQFWGLTLELSGGDTVRLERVVRANAEKLQDPWAIQACRRASSGTANHPRRSGQHAWWRNGLPGKLLAAVKLWNDSKHLARMKESERPATLEEIS